MPTITYEPLEPVRFLDTETGEEFNCTVTAVTLTKPEEKPRSITTTSGRRITAEPAYRFPSKITFDPAPEKSLAGRGPYDATIETKKFRIVATGRFTEELEFDVQTLTVRPR